MRVGTVSGTQLAFFTFALLLLTVPLAEWMAKAVAAEAATRDLIGRVLIFAPAAALLFGIPALRRQALDLLAPRIPAPRMAEVVGVSAAKALLFGLAASGALALWEWHLGGDAKLLHRIQSQAPATQMAYALSIQGLAKYILVGAVLAPVLEELVIRGFLYRAWERQWGVWPSMLLTSALFAVYHKHFFAAFASGLIFAALMRRTRSLRAPIAAHAAFNLFLWYPLMGQFNVPGVTAAGKGLAAWSVQLAVLAVAVVVIPYYVWLASKGGRITESRAG